MDDELRKRIEGALHDMTSDATKVLEAVQRAGEEALIGGDLQAACNEVALLHYPLGHLHDGRSYILEHLEKHGVKPGVKPGGETPPS